MIHTPLPTSRQSDAREQRQMVNPAVLVVTFVWFATFGLIGSTTLVHAVVPLWEKKPVVFTQALAGASPRDYLEAREQWKRLGYSPSNLSGVHSGHRLVKYSGLWHKDFNVLDWKSEHSMSESMFYARHTQLVAQQFRVHDMDVHVINNIPYYNAIWIKDKRSVLSKISTKLSKVELTHELSRSRMIQYRPVKINPYQLNRSTFYSVVWVKDGLTNVRVHIDQSSSQLQGLLEGYSRQGYHPVDIAGYQKYGLKYSGIWLKDSKVINWVSYHDMLSEQFQEHQQALRKQNYRMIDLDTYFESPRHRIKKHSGIWIQTEPRNQLVSNLSLLKHPNLQQLRIDLKEYLIPGRDGRSGSLGFYIEDLTNGNYIAYNPHEPFYMASTAKVFIGAKVTDMPELNVYDPLQLHQLTDEDWRGEGTRPGKGTRGFEPENIGDSFSTRTYLRNMIDRSDTASTDKLHNLVETHDGEAAIDRYVRQDCGILNVGEITTICEVDRRIHATRDACVLDVPCHTFETWHRDGLTAAKFYATDDDLNCFDKLVDAGVVGDARRAPYYASLANSITPAEYSRFWNGLAKHERFNPGDERFFYRELSKNIRNPFTNQMYFDAIGGKGGDKYEATSWVGIAWNWKTPLVKPIDVLPQYSIVVFTEDWSGDWKSPIDQIEYDKKKIAANTIINAVMRSAIPYLASQRLEPRTKKSYIR